MSGGLSNQTDTILHAISMVNSAVSVTDGSISRNTVTVIVSEYPVSATLEEA